MIRPFALALVLALGGCARERSPRAAPEPSTPPALATALHQPPEALLAGTSLAVAYSGYRSGQHPDRGQGEIRPSPEQIREDLDLLLAHGVSLIRVYSSGAHTRDVLAVIEDGDLPVKVVLGAWLEAEVSAHETCAWLTEPIPPEELAQNRVRNGEELQRAIALARAHPDVIVAVSVGNETLVDWNDHRIPVESVVAYASQVRGAIDQPVTTADNYVPWIEHADRLGAVMDFAFVHTYPVWEGKDIDEGLPYTLDNLAGVREASPDLPLVVGEAGWASEASEFGERASEAKQARYVRELTTWAAETNTTVFVFEAFDEEWKGAADNPAGAEKHWGLWNADRRPKAAVGVLGDGLDPK